MPSDNRVFLPRLPEGATEEVLKAHFGRFGEITDCYIPVNPTNGKPKGLAFITFSTGEQAGAAVAQTEQQINGETCEVLKAAPKPDKRSGGGPIRRDPDITDPYMAGFLHAQRMMMGGSAPMMPPSRDVPTSRERYRVFVRDVPEAFDDDTLKRYFDKFGEITDLYQPEHKGAEGKKKKGIAYITYKTEQQQSACLAQGETHTVEGVEMSVTRADARREKERPGMPGWAGGYDIPYRSNERAPRRPDFGGGGYGSGSGPSRSASQSNRIFAGGISPELTSDQVAEHFRQHGGEISDIYFPKDVRSGSKRGFCYITFQENLAVHRALANAPREINGFPIGEVKVAEARPGDFAPGGGRGRGGSERGDRGGDMGGYGYGGGGGGHEGRGRSSYDRNSYEDGGMGWGAGGMGMMPMGYGSDMGYGARTAEQWSSGAGGYGMGGFGDGMPRQGAEMMERMAPLLNLLATASATGAYGGANQQAGDGYGGGGAAGWGQGGSQGGLGGLQAQGGGYGQASGNGQRSNDSADGRYRPY